jgi:RNA polymerase sigma-70 factor, ECF subfamily
LPGETEQELVRHLRRGDPSAFHRLVDAYGDRLFGLAFSLVGNAADAEDIVQETLAGAFRGIKSFEQRAALWTWLARILVRQVARWRRSTRSRKTLRLDDDDQSPGGHEPAQPGPSPQIGVDAKVDLAAALETLSAEHREVIVLREIEQMSYEQITEVLGIPPGTVDSRLYRARAELRKRLSDWATSK